ncbi:MAG: peroxiredoxin/tetratricopeptide (TPR) repeat protein [Verrucomicrobiales bacterium]|jgi:peroxiredoxin/tetratricopeptide (TPR) repeat protein
MKIILPYISAVFALLSGAVFAEDPAKDPADPPKEGHSHAGESFNAGPRQAAVRIPGTGGVHFPITTNWDQGQAYFDQGVGQLHGFWYYEAERTFRQIAAKDPNCAMAFWGMSMANQSNLTRAKDFIGEAKDLIDKASPQEKLWIEARAKYLGDEPKDKKKRQRNLIRDLENIVQDYPDAVEAKAFLVVRIWQFGRSGLPISSHQAVDALLDQIFAKVPLHPAHHYRIHLWDSEKPERALASAAVLHETAPAIAHMWHMPGHTYDKLKRYPESAWHQEASARVDHKRQNELRILPDQIHNYAHNNEWYSRNLAHMGRVREAIDFAKSMIDNPMHPTLNHYGKGGSSCSYGRRRLMEYLERFERWEEVLELSQTHYLEPTDKEDEQLKKQRLVGLANFELGRAVEFGVVLGRLKARLSGLEEEKKVATTAAREKAEGEKKDKKAVDAAGAEAAKKFKGRIDQVKRTVEEFEVYAQVLEPKDGAVPSVDTLKKVKREKPALARLHQRLGHTEQALEFGKAAMEAEKNRVEPLASYVHVLESAGKSEEAASAFGELKKISGYMDTDSEAYRRAAVVAKRLGEPDDWRVKAAMPDDFGNKSGLEALGPLAWQAPDAIPFDLVSDSGTKVSLQSLSGKPVLLIFYLGHGCKHCVEQLNAFAPMADEFEAAGIPIIAVAPEESLELVKTHALCDGDEPRFPFPLLSDPSMSVFRGYGAYDDFEEMGLHGTYLISPEGKVIWQDIGADPFMDAAFLLKEAKRQLEL